MASRISWIFAQNGESPRRTNDEPLTRGSVLAARSASTTRANGRRPFDELVEEPRALDLAEVAGRLQHQRRLRGHDRPAPRHEERRDDDADHRDRDGNGNQRENQPDSTARGHAVEYKATGADGRLERLGDWAGWSEPGRAST